MSYERVDPYVLAERLSVARKAAKITQEAAADHLGVSRPTYIAMEKGTRRPRPDELVKLAKLYNEPLNKLLRDEKKLAPNHPHLRASLGSLGGGEEEVESAVAKLQSFVDDYQFLESLAGSKSVGT
jgi:transcriptional regulator with XRE-family HTH domain